jgi:hypothetical protein
VGASPVATPSRYPKALRLQPGGTAERGQPPRGQLGDEFDAGALSALGAGALGQLSAAAASFCGTVGSGDRSETVNIPPPRRSGSSAKAVSALPVALPALGDRQTPSTCRPAVLLAAGIGSNVDVMPRKRRWPRHAGSVVGRVALPSQNRPPYPDQSPACRPWCRRPRHAATVAGPAR